MSDLIKFLQCIEDQKIEAIRANVPKALLENLDIQPGGTVNLEALLKICLRIKKFESLKSKNESIKENVTNLIFNSKIAADFKHQLKKK